jgi:hypothetical protein
MHGGSANLDVLPKDYYYEYNSDPVMPKMTGGKRRRRRLRGGDGMDSLLNSQNVNTLMGANQAVDPDITVQPAANPFSGSMI